MGECPRRGRATGAPHGRFPSRRNRSRTPVSSRQREHSARLHYPIRQHQGAYRGPRPLPNPGHPVGLSFCVAPDVQPIPRSLTNIYKELTDDLGVPMPTNGDLTPWTNQGVMLLNRCLTVEAGKPGSHQDKGGRSLPTRRSKRLTTAAIPMAASNPWSPSCGGARRRRWDRCSPTHILSPHLIRVLCPRDTDSSVQNRSPAPTKRSSPQARSLWTGPSRQLDPLQ